MSRRVLERTLAVSLATASLLTCGGDAAPPVARAACGNGSVEAGEECDDGNAANDDSCLTTCNRPAAWVPGDPHLHGGGCGVSETPESLAARLRAQGLRVGSALVWGSDYETQARYFTGRDQPLAAPDVLLHYDLEISDFPAGDAGHLLLLGLDSLQFSADPFRTPRSGVPVVEWARAQPHALVGMAHLQLWPDDGSFPRPPVDCCMPWEAVVHAARGRLSFLSMERLPEGQAPVDDGTFLLFRALQNTGFRVAIAGASDWPCVTASFDARTPRTDVIVDGALTYETWLQGLRAGRTAIAIGAGTRLNLRVEGHRLGEELALAAAREVSVTVESVAPAAQEVAILVNGAVAARVPVAAGAQVATVRVPVSSSAWIAARGAHVLTSPVYVLLAQRPIRASADDACYLLRYVQTLRRYVTSGRLPLGESEDEALRAYDEAAAELQRRFGESGGQSCS